ncbi:MAG: hypothetical protein FJ294_06950 [Planctomycetes bacterium]|nr:hypothetical protein [Planctomycetota bacterium]
MEPNDFYSDRKFCAHCNKYVHYLLSLQSSHCVECGQEVRLFSERDWKQFHEQIEVRKSKGGRLHKGEDKKSA